MLGLASGGTVTIDADAAGYGWFVDETPFDDEEFDPFGNSLVATDDDAIGRMDLLTAVFHELGHMLGLEDIYDSTAEDDLMYGWLAAGLRRTADAGDVDRQ